MCICIMESNVIFELTEMSDNIYYACVDTLMVGSKVQSINNT